MSRERLPFDIRRQPDDVTCGPTCLHAVYRYFEDDLPFSQVLTQVPTLAEGGTLGVLLANHALARGYQATIVTWNLQVFDPTWFEDGVDLQQRLRLRSRAKQDAKLSLVASAFDEFLARGGRVEFRDLEADLLRRYLRRGVPILTGLSSTFLYREAREDPLTGRPDDVAGEPSGHFVVLTGYEPKSRRILVSDPMYPNPLSENHTYKLEMDRVIGAIYLGVLTHDANLVAIEPRPRGKHGGAHGRRR